MWREVREGGKQRCTRRAEAKGMGWTGAEMVNGKGKG